ncbi:hypothetical protein [Actinokineospora sp. NPDC004072]
MTTIVFVNCAALLAGGVSAPGDDASRSKFVDEPLWHVDRGSAASGRGDHWRANLRARTQIPALAQRSLTRAR